MSFTIHISDKSGAIGIGEIERIRVILAEQGVPSGALHQRAIPDTSKDLGAHSKFHMVWITDLEEQAAREIAEAIAEKLDKTCRVSEAGSAG